MPINPNNRFDRSFSEDVFQTYFRELIAKGEAKTVPAGECIVTEGSVCSYLYYVKSGAFKAIRFPEDKEVILGFTFKGDLDTSPYAFLYGHPSRETIQAITDCEVIRISKRDFDAIAQKNPDFRSFMVYLLANYVETLVNRFVEFKAETAEFRYLQLLREQPQEAKSIPLQDLASYLGITKERLSRIRKKHPDLI
ncbi:Crp/Fnr family transcriptional regulator [Robertkochia aurantiaca]|uniref:Crp/Fnr family transcriptional regulator n=1 Tax=Robertkochia aurantiaca TaxID=2873700 RepID=UPI001CCAF843|nr:Crp/Fnr family transcriptional regulator [Robertkochia sp. 3YJGBD-33]